MRGKTPDTTTDLAHQRRLVEAFLAAARDGEFDALLATLDDDAVLHVDAPNGRLAIVLRFTVSTEKIMRICIDADPERLRRFSFGVLD